MLSQSVRNLTLALVVALCSATNSRADQSLLFDFGAPGHDGVSEGVTHDFSSTTLSTPKLTATAQGTGNPVLILKDGGTNETGLGIRPDAGGDNEIDLHHSVLLNFTALEAAGYGSIQFTLGSTQEHEGYMIFGSNVAGSQGSLLKTDDNASGADPLVVTSAQIGLFKFYTITAATDDLVNHSAANIVLASVVVTSTPEPGTVAMALTALPLFGLGALARRRARA
jgi:hypothetical protein